MIIQRLFLSLESAFFFAAVWEEEEETRERGREKTSSYTLAPCVLRLGCWRCVARGETFSRGSEKDSLRFKKRAALLSEKRAVFRSVRARAGGRTRSSQVLGFRAVRSRGACYLSPKK